MVYSCQEVLLMNIGERINTLRKDVLHLTLEQFGDRIGVTKMTISRLENGVNSVTDQMFRSICREFHVNEEWLRDGTGDMFVQRSRNQVIAEFLNEVMEDVEPSFRKRFIEALSVLDESDWAVLEKIADQLAARKKVSDE